MSLQPLEIALGHTLCSMLNRLQRDDRLAVRSDDDILSGDGTFNQLRKLTL